MKKKAVVAVAKMSLNNYLSSRRAVLKLTQRAIALKLDVTVQHISNLETGRTIPSDLLCLRLAPVLEVKPEVLVLMVHREKACFVSDEKDTGYSNLSDFLDSLWSLFTGTIETALTNKKDGR